MCMFIWKTYKNTQTHTYTHIQIRAPRTKRDDFRWICTTWKASASTHKVYLHLGTFVCVHVYICIYIYIYNIHILSCIPWLCYCRPACIYDVYNLYVSLYMYIWMYTHASNANYCTTCRVGLCVCVIRMYKCVCACMYIRTHVCVHACV